MLKQTLLEVISRLYRVKLHHDSWGVKCWRGEIYILIDARIHDTVNTRPCNNWRCYKQRGGIGLAKADEVQTHHELGRVCSSALVEIFFFFFNAGIKRGRHSSRYIQNSETQQSKPDEKVTNSFHRPSILSQVTKTVTFHIADVWPRPRFSARFSFLSRKLGAALFFFPSPCQIRASSQTRIV